jgi:NlpC/P60 family
MPVQQAVSMTDTRWYREILSSPNGGVPMGGDLKRNLTMKWVLSRCSILAILLTVVTGIHANTMPFTLQEVLDTYSYVDANPLAYIDPFGLDLSAGQQAAVVAAAQAWSQANVPYLWGGSTRAGADCSGSISGIYNEAGIDIGRLTSQGFTQSPFSLVPAGQDLQPGDVGVYPGHVVVYGGADNTGVSGRDVWSASHTGGNPFGPASSSWYGSPTWYRYNP